MPDVLTVEEAAEYLRVTRSTLPASARQGEISGKKIGRQWRFSRCALPDWLADRREVEEDRALARATEKALDDPDSQELMTEEEFMARLGR
jgi:excisionase family DNA binding protein